MALSSGFRNENGFVAEWRVRHLFGVMTAAKGSWVSGNHFSAIVDELALINLWQWDLYFDSDTVTFQLESLAGGELPATVTGTMTR